MLETKRKLQYVFEWRTHRRLSLRQLALRLEIEPGEELLSATSLNRIENDQQALTPAVLHALAAAFDCGPEDVLTVNPLLQPEVIDFMAAVRRIRGLDRDEILRATKVLAAMA